LARAVAAVRPRKGGRGAEQNRALRLLAGSPLGCTEAIMLPVGGWLRITDVGRQAVAGK
jgi:hypothetical protein